MGMIVCWEICGIVDRGGEKRVEYALERAHRKCQQCMGNECSDNVVCEDAAERELVRILNSDSFRRFGGCSGQLNNRSVWVLVIHSEIAIVLVVLSSSSYFPESRSNLTAERDSKILPVDEGIVRLAVVSLMTYPTVGSSPLQDLAKQPRMQTREILRLICLGASMEMFQAI